MSWCNGAHAAALALRWGRVADPSLPWAMVFPQSGAMLPRHPSQIYEALLEGAVLFAILCILLTRFRLPYVILTGVFFIA
jgi:phosphatidylglycerol:prolipoprotein diacylglycerol transferase